MVKNSRQLVFVPGNLYKLLGIYQVLDTINRNSTLLPDKKENNTNKQQTNNKQTTKQQTTNNND